MTKSKYIQGFIDKTEKKIEKLRNEAYEAYRDWGDTGYQRFMNKHDRLIAEADELESFINPDLNDNYYREKINTLQAENERMVMLLKSLGNVVDEMKYSFPDCTETRRLELIVSQFKYDCNGVLK